jgi:ATP-binding cassette subfamily F protein 3
VQVGDIFLTIKGRELLEAAFLRLISGRRYGLIGRNGCGKTTLLRRIAQHKLAGFPAHVRALHVKQEVIGSDTVTVLEVSELLISWSHLSIYLTHL